MVEHGGYHSNRIMRPRPAADDPAPSKSQRKRDMLAVQALGERLVALPSARLAAFDLPEPLLEAIALAQRITSHEGRRRQLQYVGRLMRGVDADAIRDRLDADGTQHRLETAVMHAAERWRDTLLAESSRLAEFAERHPAADAAALHTAVRAARAEAARGPHGRWYRELYRQLRDAIAADVDQDRPDA